MGVRIVIAKSILSATSGYIAEAGFTHSLTPARNCTFGCTYCYVPTLGIYGGLKPEDWQRWGQFTTFKENAPELLHRQLRAEQRIYCSPLVDPYQPAEAEVQMMPRILDELIASPPRVLTIQTRGLLILRDLDLVRELSFRTTLRVSFSITTNRDEVRRLYEPHCAPIAERIAAIAKLRAAGIETFATLAPILPCDPEELARIAIEASGGKIIGDPLHIRATKSHGATTREQAFRIAKMHDHEAWFDAAFQARIVERIDAEARRAGVEFEIGPRGFSKLAQ